MNTNIINRLFFKTNRGGDHVDDQKTIGIPAPGIYPFEFQSLGERSRIHLRIDGDLSKGEAKGILLVNANRVVHLNNTATLMAYFKLNELSDETVINTIKKVYKVSQTQAASDYA
ncbi:MAG: hypothetical protein ACWGN2_01720, partial [Anaerolineales bacterium]